MRTPPLASPNPCEALAEGRPGTNASRTGGQDSESRAHPEHAGVNGEIKGADGKAGGVASENGDHRTGAEYAENCAGSTEQKAFGKKSATQGSGGRAQCSADG